MLIFCWGKDTYRSRDHLHKMIDRFKAERDPKGYNVARLDATAVDEAAPILEQILAVPFLAERRLVVVENLLVSKHTVVQEDISARLAAGTLPESTVIIFWEGTDSFKTKLAKQLAERLRQEKFSRSFDELTLPELRQWIETEVAKTGRRLAPNALGYLLQHGGGDLWQLHAIIEQSLAYSSGTPARRDITIADIQLFLPEKISDDIFRLVDAILQGELATAYEMVAEQYRQGKDVFYIFAMLLRQCRILLRLRDLSEQESRITSELAAKKLQLHPFVVKKSWMMVKRHSLVTFQSMYQRLLDFDLAIKTGQGEPRVMFDILIARFSIKNPSERGLGG